MRCSSCSGGVPGAVGLGAPSGARVLRCGAAGTAGRGAVGRGTAFLHRRGRAVRALPLRERVLLWVVKRRWPGLEDRVRGVGSALPEGRRLAADFWAVVVA